MTSPKPPDFEERLKKLSSEEFRTWLLWCVMNGRVRDPALPFRARPREAHVGRGLVSMSLKVACHLALKRDFDGCEKLVLLATKGWGKERLHTLPLDPHTWIREAERIDRESRRKLDRPVPEAAEASAHAREARVMLVVYLRALRRFLMEESDEGGG